MVEAQQPLHEAVGRATAQLDCPTTLIVLARQAAMRAVKRKLVASGLKVRQFEQKAIVSAAEDYLSDHPELIEQAAETVRSHPKIRTLAEREARDRRRNRR
jgi:hypothetical protein